jgi:hypothetical protein
MLIAKIIELICFILLIIWWFVDWIMILCNFYKDENGLSLFKDI